jgi:hypothetical protein
VKEWSPEDWQYFMNAMIKNVYETQPSFHMAIEMLHCKLMLRDNKIFEIMELLKELTSIDKKQNWFARYEIMKVTFQLHETFFKKQEANPHPIYHAIRKVDKLNDRFYEKCGEIITRLYKFWSNVVAYKISIDDQLDGIPLTPFIQEDQGSKLELITEANMEKTILKITHTIKIVEKLLVKIAKLSNAKQESIALSCVKFLATYSHESQDSIMQTSSILESEHLGVLSTALSSRDFS